MIELILYCEIYAFCLVITGLMLLWLVRSALNSTSDQWLRRVLGAFVASFACNLIFTLLKIVNLPMQLQLPLLTAFKTAFHITLGAGVYAWCGYADIQNGGRLFSKRKTFLCTLVMLAIPVAMALWNLKSHQLFEITAEGEYKRHFLFHWEMGYFAALSTAFSLPMLSRLPEEQEPSRRGHLWLTASFPLCVLAAWLMTTVGEQIPVICVCVTIELLCLYVDSSTRQISMDKLTQVNNRQNLMSFLEFKMRYHEESIFLLMIDVDYFKPINDTYGHLEGDEALIQISKVLKKSCAGYRRRPYIGRYGGDEFIIILEGTREEMEALCNSIRTLLKEYCTSAGKPYTLTVSIGVSRWHPDMTPQSFIADADAQLYEIKRNREKPAGLKTGR